MNYNGKTPQYSQRLITMQVQIM